MTCKATSAQLTLSAEQLKLIEEGLGIMLSEYSHTFTEAEAAAAQRLRESFEQEWLATETDDADEAEARRGRAEMLRQPATA